MIGLEVRYWINWYHSILLDLRAVKLGKRLRYSTNGQNGAVVTKKWIDATERRMNQLLDKLPKETQKMWTFKSVGIGLPRSSENDEVKE